MCRKQKPGRVTAIAAAVAAVLLAAFFAACKGPIGPDGEAGPAGPAGASGLPGVDFQDGWKWKVTFDPDGGKWAGGSVPLEYIVIDGGTAAAPAAPVKSSGISGISGVLGLMQMVGDEAALGFLGWAKGDGSLWNFSGDTVTEDITLKALWSEGPQVIQGAESVSSAVDHIRKNPGKYVLVSSGLPGTFIINNALMLSGGSDLTIICYDDSAYLSIETSVKSPIFVVSGAGTKLTLKGNINLRGNDNSFDNAFPQVRVEAGAKFVLDAIVFPDQYGPGNDAILDVLINNNFNDSSTPWNSYGASAVFVTGAGSEFTMNGGYIEQNASVGPSSAVTANAAVGLAAGGSFIMNDGFIQYNEGTQGAVVLAGLADNITPSGSTFTMNGGEINSNYNTAPGHFNGAGHEMSQWAGNGAAVNIQNGTFTMNGGKIKDNPAYESTYNNVPSGAAGVYINSNNNAAFIMNGGTLNNVNGLSDIYVGHGNAEGAGSRGSLTLSGDITIGIITLHAAPYGNNNEHEADATFIKLAGPITAADGSIAINFQANSPATVGVIAIWKDRVVLQGTPGYAIIPQTQVSKFALGKYCGDGSSGGFNSVSIPSGHILFGSGTGEVKLYQP